MWANVFLCDPLIKKFHKHYIHDLSVHSFQILVMEQQGGQA